MNNSSDCCQATITHSHQTLVALDWYSLPLSPNTCSLLAQPFTVFIIGIQCLVQNNLSF